MADMCDEGVFTLLCGMGNVFRTVALYLSYMGKKEEKINKSALF